MSISKVLIKWYNLNKRDLPWRETNNPYIIWVSEIILQQTRVNQGIHYFYRFIEHFPDIKSLADAPVDDVLKLWQGLGYYSRARNMHQAAKTIMNDYGGKFPQDYSEILKLKGIGEYTAAAIGSFCFNTAVPVIDGNVIRFLSRFFGVYESISTAKGKKTIKKLAEENIDSKNPGTYNQAIMEFGALQCTPKNPDCIECPLRKECYAYSNNLISDLPVKKKKIKITKRYFNYIHIIYKENTFIEQRTEKDIWHMLYQLPLIETKTKSSTQEIINHELWEKIFENSNPEIVEITNTIKHQLSHQQLFTRFYKVVIKKPTNYLKQNYLTINHADIEKYGVPRLIDRYFKKSM